MMWLIYLRSRRGRTGSALGRVLRGVGLAAIGPAGLGLGATGCSGKTPDSQAQPTNCGSDGGGGAGTSIVTCREGEFSCCGSVARRCDGNGNYTQSIECRERPCVERLGCVLCTPGEGTCAGGVAEVCKKDGSGFDPMECDAVQGMRCEPDGCKGPCTPAELKDTYLGCEYYPTMMLNPVWRGFDFAVAVANAGNAVTNALVTRGNVEVMSTSIPAGQLGVLRLPWVDELKGGDVDACQNPPEPGSTRLVTGGAYRLRTDQPVTVYQLSPLEYEILPAPANCPVGTLCETGGVVAQCLSYSNDASLLLPVTALTHNYTAISWPATEKRAGVVTVTATRDETDLDVLGVGSFAPGAGITQDGQGSLRLNRGDVLELVTEATAAEGVFGTDLSGTRLRASAPVQVLAGHSCANVPEPRTSACDHVEHAMLPSETWGNDHFVTVPADLPRELVVRIVALQPDTHIDFDPGLVAPATIGPSQTPMEIRISGDLRVQSDKPVSVAGFMLGQTAVTGGRGDPSMTIAVPTEQYRRQYLFVASTTFDDNWINVVAPSGANVSLDGAALPKADFVPIGASGFVVSKVLLGRTDVHTIEGDVPFGVTVYGYGRYTSYMYAGGLDLKHLTPQIVY